MSNGIVPGPCPLQGCPPATEIVCIETSKVYDFCFQTETRDNVCLPISRGCPSPLPPGTTASGAVTNVTCTTIAVTPIPLPPPWVGNDDLAVSGFANVTLLITVTVTYTLTGPTGTVLCSFSGPFSFMKTVTLCAPAGTSISCEIPSSAVGPAAIIDGQVCASVTLCVLIESLALVKLLVPSYGFCTPAPCVVSPTPPFTCPPSPLFPPQCLFPTAT